MATKNGKTTYHLTDPRIGGPHNVAVDTYYLRDRFHCAAIKKRTGQPVR